MHPTDGALRRALDEPASLPDVDRAHVATCAHCQQLLADATADRDYAQALLSVNDPAPDADQSLDAQWQRLRVGATTRPVATSPATAQRPRRRRVHRATVLTAAGAVLVIGGATAAAANDWLPVFHTESVAPVSISPSSMSDLTDIAGAVDLSGLSAYGSWQQLSHPQLHTVPDAAAAERRTGLTVTPLTDLPTGVTGEPSYRIVGQQSGVFQFSTQKAQGTVTAAGGTLPALPPALDGAQLRLQVGPAVLQVWQQRSGIPALVVAEVGAPTAQTSGVSLAVLRDALLSLPGLPPDLAAQLRAVTSDGTTLPIPVPDDQFSSSTTTVAGAPATLIASKDGTLTGVIWVSDGIVRVVGGPLSQSEVLSVANQLG
jgi:hypothetical protein